MNNADKERARRDALLTKAKRERRQRYEHAKGQERILLDFNVDRDDLTVPEVCDFFGISRSSLLLLTRRHIDELKKTGHQLGTNNKPARYSRLNLLHLAMMLRPSTSEVATMITKRLGWYRPVEGVTEVSQQVAAVHVNRCSKIIDQALSIVADVHDLDPAVVWRELEKLDDYRKNALIVTLAALIPMDQPGLKQYLVSLSAKTDDEPRAERGLALLVPPKRQQLRVVNE
jgi:hypothetical protein